MQTKEPFHDNDEYDLIRRILNSDENPKLLLQLIKNHHFGCIALLISLGILTNKHEDEDVKHCVSKEFLLSNALEQDVATFNKIYMNGRPPTDRKYMINISDKVGKIKKFIKNGDITSKKYDACKSDLFDFLDRNKNSDTDYWAIAFPRVRLVDTVSDIEGLDDIYVPSFFHDLQATAKNKSRENRENLYSESHASIELFDTFDTVINGCPIKKNALFKPIIKNILLLTKQIREGLKTELNQDKLCKFLGEYIDYKTALFDKALLKHSKYHLYTVGIISIYREFLEDKHIVELLTKFFDKYKDIYQNFNNYKNESNVNSHVFFSLTDTRLNSAYSLLKRYGILNSNIEQTGEELQPEQKKILHSVLNSLSEYKKEGIYLGNIPDKEKDKIHNTISAIRNNNVVNIKLYEMKDLLAHLKLYIPHKKDNKEPYKSVITTLQDIFEKDIGCVDFAKVSVLYADFIELYNKIYDKKYFGEQYGTDLVVNDKNKKIELIEMLNANVRKIFNFSLSIEYKLPILDLYKKHLKLQKYMMEKIRDDSTILGNALVKFPTFFFREIKNLRITKKHLNELQKEISNTCDPDAKKSLTKDLNEIIPPNRPASFLKNIIKYVVAGIIASIPIYFMFIGLYYKLEKEYSVIKAAIFGCIIGIFVAINAFNHIQSKSTKFIKITIMINTICIVASLALIMLRIFPQINSVFFTIPEIEPSSCTFSMLTAGCLLFIGIIGLLCSIKYIRETVFVDHTACNIKYGIYFSSDSQKSCFEATNAVLQYENDTRPLAPNTEKIIKFLDTISEEKEISDQKLYSESIEKASLIDDNKKENYSLDAISEEKEISDPRSYSESIEKAGLIDDNKKKNYK